MKSDLNRDNIILIGMPGAGKSTLGVILAKVMGYRFVDADIVIQQEENALLSDIIKREGPEGFIAIENEINAKISAARSIIATGGSAVYGIDAMKHFKDIGTIVYLKISYPAISLRLSDIKSRGVVLKEGQTLKDIFSERSVLYEKYADIIIDTDGLDIEMTLERVLEALSFRCKNQ